MPRRIVSFRAANSDSNSSHQGNFVLPRLCSRAEAASYCGLSIQSFSAWVKLGRLPRALPGTARWDLRAIDAALDVASGTGLIEQEDAFDKWKRERDEKRTSRHSKRD